MKQEALTLIRTNYWYFIPFLLWVIIGGILLSCFNQTELFMPVNQHHHQWLDYAMTGFSAYGRGDIIPFILVPIAFLPAFRNKTYVESTILFGLLIPTFIFLAKQFFQEPRPILVYGKEFVHRVPWLVDLRNNSFPSGHTLAAFGFFLILSLILPKKHKPWSLLFIILAMLCGYSRMYLGQHFFKDVYVGSICGVVFTFIIYWLVHHKYKKREQMNPSTRP